MHLSFFQRNNHMREKLPARRPATRFTFKHEGHTYQGAAGHYENGRIGEVFLTSGKSGTHLQISLHDASIAASIALQRGSTAEELLKACLKDEAGRPAGALGKMFELLVQLEKEEP
jgi:hypothetical protein